MSADGGFRRHFHSQVAWYLGVGTIGFAADAGAYWLFAHGFGWPVIASRLAAFVPATLVTWIINRRYTFDRTDGAQAHRALEYLRYLAVQGTGIVVSFITFQSVLHRWAGHDFLALAAGSILALAFNFAGSRWLVFTGQRQDASLLALAGFGLLSVALGQDDNWDLHNYHLYNAYAFLTDRLHVDLAPAGLQTYFNPVIDLPYYVMAMNLPAPAVAFVMGLAHATTVLLLVALARRVLPDATPKQVWLLALAGCLGPTFLAELGTTMGDSTTAPLVLGALVLVLASRRRGHVQTRDWIAGQARNDSPGVMPDSAHQDLVVMPGSTRHPGRTVQLAAAGLLVGVATGLKLTNAPFAVGLAAALLVMHGGWLDRVKSVATLTLTGTAGLALTAGFWFWRMWVEFANPLYPQFNTFFQSPFAGPSGVNDPRWGPVNAGEALAYPFVFAFDPGRFAETPLVLILWPVAYAVCMLWALVTIARRNRATADEPATPDAARALLAFVVVSYALWLAVFAIGRYALVIEVLLPLLLWLLVPRIVRASWARKAVVAVIAMAVAASVLTFRTWGHGGYAERDYDVQAPPIANPSTATVIFLWYPLAWTAVFLPKELAFMSVTNFAESKALVARADELVKRRGGELYAFVPATTDTTATNVERFNAWARKSQLSADGSGCALVRRTIRLSNRYATLIARPGPLCAFDLPPGLARDVAAGDRALLAEWQVRLAGRKLRLVMESCGRYEARVGTAVQPYLACRMTR